MKSLRKNFLYSAAYQLLLILLPLIRIPHVSRALGADGLGIYSYTYTVAGYFVLAAMLGVKNYGSRSVAAVREDRPRLSSLFWQIYGLQLCCALAAAAAYGACVLLGQPSWPRIARLQGLYVFSAALDISWLYAGLEEFRLTVLRSAAVRLACLGGVLLLVRTEADLWKYTLLLALEALASQACLWPSLRRFVDWRRPSARQLLSHLRPELTLFVPVAAVSLYKMMDKVMLGRMSTAAQVGYYEAAEKILSLPLGLITALGTVMLPRMSHLAAAGRTAQSRQYISGSMRFAVFLSCGLCFGAAGVAPELVPVFLGEAYAPCVLLLQVLAPTVLFIAWANVIRTQYLLPNRLDQSYLLSVALGALVNLGTNALLIPRLEGLGAAVGTLCAEGAVCLCQSWMVRRELEIGRCLKTTAPLLPAGAVMWLLVRQIRRLFARPCLAALGLEIAAGAAFYLLAAALWLRKPAPRPEEGAGF